MKNQILVLTHGEMAKGIMISLRVILNENNAVDTLCVMEQDSPEAIKDKIKVWLDKQSTNHPIIIVTDIPFGSTTVLASPFVQQYKNLLIYSGLNLAMLIGFCQAEISNENAREILNQICNESKEMIGCINDRMEQIQQEEEF